MALFRWAKPEDQDKSPDSLVFSTFKGFNNSAPQDSYRYYFSCDVCDVKWRGKSNVSECWCCGTPIEQGA